MLDITQAREVLIQPCLTDIKAYSEDAEELLIATLAQESSGGCYLKQMTGPALGIFQMEPKTYDDLWNTYIGHNAALCYDLLVSNQMRTRPPATDMIYNLKLATQMARILYLRIRHPIPNKNDLDGIWDYYKTYYNSVLGSATKPDFVKNYYKFTKKKAPVTV